MSPWEHHAFSYNEDGSRASKTVNGLRHNYTWDGQTLVRDYYGNTILDFSYDANGQPYSMHYNSTPYFYILNLQGDVIRMVDGNGNTVASYEYDPYGRVISATGSMAEINPLRYRGYYYDQETGLYYLQSRYYDPNTCRFINADSYASTGQGILGHNMFAYCQNNPVMGYDPNGNWDWGWEERAAFGATVLIVGLALLLAAPTGGSSLAFGGLMISATTAISAGSAMTLVGTVIIGNAATQATVNYAKKSRQSDKERSTEHPSWVSQSDVDLNKSAQENATDLLNNKYGEGNWKKGPSSDFNQIVKWINRSLKAVALIMLGGIKEEFR